MTTLTTHPDTAKTKQETWQRDFAHSMDALLARQTAILERHQEVHRFVRDDIAPILKDIEKSVTRYGFKCLVIIADAGASLTIERNVHFSEQTEGEFTYSLSFAIAPDAIEAMWDDQWGRDKPGFSNDVWDDIDDLPADIVYKRFDPPVTSLSELRDHLQDHFTQRFLLWLEEMFITLWLNPRSSAWEHLGKLPSQKHKSSISAIV